MDDPSEPKQHKRQPAARLLLIVGALAAVFLVVYATTREQPDVTGGEPPSPVPTTPAPQTGLDEVLAQVLKALPEGRMLFNPPQEMSQGERERVELRVLPLSEAIDETAAQATLAAGLQGAGAPEVQALRVGTVMRARLSGEGFEITPLNEEEQVVASDTFTQWAWDVTALEAGERQLNLLVTVRLFAGELGERGRDLPVITKGVQVRVDPVYSARTFVSRNWQWLVTALLLHGAGWLVRTYSGSKSTQGGWSPE